MRFLRSSSWLAALVAGTCFGTLTLAAQEGASAQAQAIFERWYQGMVDRSPELHTSLGLKTNAGKWDDRSEARAAEELAHLANAVAELQRSVDSEELDESTRLSARLFLWRAEQTAEAYRYRNYNPIFDQTGGRLTAMTNLLVTNHRVDAVADAEAYLQRLHGMGAAIDQALDRLHHQAKAGLLPPRWVFPKAAEIFRNLVTGAPFDAPGADSPLWADFQRKLAALTVDAATTDRLRADARQALLTSFGPAVERVLTAWQELETQAGMDDGAWRLPEGEAYYAFRLRASTNSSLGAEAVHQIGLDEVQRIQNEMRAIMRQVGFTGELAEFFRFAREDPQFYLPNTPEGRAEYLRRATQAVETMTARLDELFLRRPQADLVVVATEAYREKTAAKAFYQRPAPNGTRPGMYYVTLYNMREMPLYQLEAIAYHEGVPGHHMQIAIAQELPDLPKFRRFGGETAYIEGWGLYCELLPKEIGLYADPYSDFGRLAMELWRAVRLVVDTGIHAKRWTREQAVAYFVANNPLSEAEAIREIERYIMNPGQAASYKMGMIKLLELRQHARARLGERFDLRAFHDVVLRDGALPLPILAEQVEHWIESIQTGRKPAARP